MSIAEVEQPSLVTQPSHPRLATDGVELTGFQPEPSSRRTSRTPIINVDDDDLAAEYISPRSNRRGQSSLSVSMDDGPPTTRQGIIEDHPVIVIEDTDAEGARVNRRISNGAQNRPIIVLDSDEEQGQPYESTNSSYRRRHGGVRRRGGRPSSSSFRIFSPPPPPPEHHPVPPVPFVPPIIAEPIPFAILPPPLSNSQRRTRLPFDEPAQPVNDSGNGGNSNGGGIQLGGGLFSQGNSSGRRHAPRAQVHFQPRRSESYDELFDESDDHPPLDRASSLFGRFFASYFSGNTFLTPPSIQRSTNASRGRSRTNPESMSSRQFHQVHNDINILDFGGERAHHPSGGFFGLTAFGGLGPWGRRDAALGLGPDYDRRMTHPDRAGPGWTYDFGTEQEGSSKADGSEILVCAKCLDPLLANADGMVDVSEEEMKGRRVWGLRCGHVLDGKCVGTLMRPEGDLANKDVDLEDNSKGKGKRRGTEMQKQVDPEHAGENEATGLVSTVDDKGKGKASTALISSPTSPLLDDREKRSPPLPSAEPVDNLPLEDTSIRSRLRSRHSITELPSSAVTSSCTVRRSARHPATPNSLTRGGSSSTRRRGTKRKPAGKTTGEEVVEERHEWVCPVSGCDRVHVSVKVGGSWKMDSEHGAVGIYV